MICLLPPFYGEVFNKLYDGPLLPGLKPIHRNEQGTRIVFPISRVIQEKKVGNALLLLRVGLGGVLGYHLGEKVA